MNNTINSKILTALISLLPGLIMSNADAVTYNLCVATTTITMPDSTIVPMWGFGLDEDNDLATVEPCPVTVPGPEISVPIADSTLTINLRNDLPVSAEPVSIVIPGQNAALNPQTFVDDSGRTRVRSFTDETATNGGITTYNWNNVQPGSYLYHSGTHLQIQVQMGLYGAVTKDAASNQAYPDIAYDETVTVLYSEIDPALHNAVDSGSYTACTAGFATCNAEKAAGQTPSIINYQPVYFLVNGEPFTSKRQASIWLGATPGDTNSKDILLRFLNAGIKTHVPVLQGGRLKVISENGEPYNHQKNQYSVALPALTTKDAIFTITDFDTPKSFALYDRSLDITNASEEVPGGLISFLIVDNDNDNDLIPNYADNCVEIANPNQEDTDNNGAGDGFGDACDGDFGGDPNIVDLSDHSVMLGLIGTPGPLGDLNIAVSPSVTLADFSIFLGLIGQPPGPSCVSVPVSDQSLCPLL